MRSIGLYLVETELGTLKYNNLPEGEILFTLRIGRNYHSLALSPSRQDNTLTFAGTLQLNVDSSALEAQRCSLSLNLNGPHDKRLLGIALVSLPKDKNLMSNNYKLTQSEDRQAEIGLKIKISPLESSSFKNTASIPLNSDSVQAEDRKGCQVASNSDSSIHLKSKKSSEAEGEGEGEERDKKRARNKGEEDKALQVTEKEVKRYKQEKEVYYQMYQIQKSKNEVASKFISSLIKKLSSKCPEVVQSLQQQSRGQSLLVNPENKKKNSEMPKNRNPMDVAAIAQLEQANRSLHRQVQEYKRIVEQLKHELQQPAKTTQKNSSQDPSSLDQVFGRRNDKLATSNNILPASLKETNDPDIEGRDHQSALAGLDLKQWLQTSIGQRQEMIALFASKIGTHSENDRTSTVEKLRTSLDRAFGQLLSRKDFTKQQLLSHKQQVSKIFEEWVVAV